jgi:hypothetical protein
VQCTGINLVKKKAREKKWSELCVMLFRSLGEKRKEVLLLFLFWSLERKERIKN